MDHESLNRQPLERSGKLLRLLPAFALLVWGCSFTAAVPATAMPTPPPAQSPSPTVLPATASPTRLSTQSPSPAAKPTLFLPTPAQTPTYDPRSAVTVTPQARAQCPPVDPSVKPSLTLPNAITDPATWDLEPDLLAYLNAGGSVAGLIRYLDQVHLGPILQVQDLTGDGVPELVVYDSHLRIFTCKDKKYFTAAVLPPDIEIAPWILFVQDMNLDGLPELVVYRPDEASVIPVREYQILEWDGETFRNLVSPQDFSDDWFAGNDEIDDGWIAISGLPALPETDDQAQSYRLQPAGDDTWELVLTGGINYHAESPYFGPWRVATTTYRWNGASFVLSDIHFEPATYRYEAVQDADAAALHGWLERARALYRQVLTSDKLLGWPGQEFDATRIAARDSLGGPTPIPAPPDPAERPNLSAYAFYRLMLLDLLEGQQPQAEADYRALQSGYPAGQPGAAYAEMGRAFWDELLSSGDPARACQSAIDYASAHPDEILHYLGDQSHSWQSHFYEPRDVCPFWQN